MIGLLAKIKLFFLFAGPIFVDMFLYNIIHLYRTNQLFSKLLKIARQRGVMVRFRGYPETLAGAFTRHPNYKRYVPGCPQPDDKPVIYLWQKNKTYLQLSLVLAHELGHHDNYRNCFHDQLMCDAYTHYFENATMSHAESLSLITEELRAWQVASDIIKEAGYMQYIPDLSDEKELALQSYQNRLIQLVIR